VWRLASLKLSTSNPVSGEIYISISGQACGASGPLLTGKGPQMVSTASLTPQRGQRLFRGLPAHREGGMDWSYMLPLAREGQMAERTYQLPGGQAGAALLASPVQPLP
jgi:hypothetical protein